MRKYHFRLETLKRFYQTERDEQQIRLAEACRSKEILQQQQAELSHQKNQLHQQHKFAIQGLQVALKQLSAVTRYKPVLRVQEKTLREQQALAAKEIEQCRENLATANRHVRTLELLDDRRRTAVSYTHLTLPTTPYV